MLIKGNTFSDQRGRLRFVNDFSFEGVKRFYVITHPNTDVIRAWQGHNKETKYFFVVKGAFILNWIHVDNWKQPSKRLEINSTILNENDSEILIIQPGYVNGFKALDIDSTLIVFSDKTLEESKEDDFRFPMKYWEFKFQK